MRHLASWRDASVPDKDCEREIEMTSDRVDLHRRLAKAKWEAYANGPDLGHITYGEEWVFTPDATMMCPLFNDGESNLMSDLATPELMEALASLAGGDVLTPEVKMWWKHMPDFRIVSPFDCVAADWGFAMRDVYSGTTADGRVLQLHEWDYVWTDDNGHITRWDWFVDSAEWAPYLDLIGLDPRGLTYAAYVANYLREGGAAG